MHSLRNAARVVRRNPRLINPAGGMHEPYAVFISRAYNAKEASLTRQHKTEEERRVLVVQFVEKYKASNEGQLPGITVLRKEVGGSPPILRKILQELKKEQSPNNSVLGTSEHESMLKMDGIENDLVTHRNKRKLACTDSPKETEEFGAKLPTLDACSMEQDIPMPMKNLGTKVVDIPKSLENINAFPSVGPDKAAAEGEAMKEKTLLAASKEKTVKQEVNVGAPCVDAGHLFLDSSQTIDRPDNDSDLAAGYIGTRQRLSQDSFHTADDADDDSDLAAPEYSEPHESSSRESLIGDNEASKRSSLRGFLDKTTKLLPHPSGFELFLRSLPAFVTTEAVLLEAFKDCGKILSARLFTPPRSHVSKRACAIVKFETEEGLRLAQMKEKEVVDNLMMQIDCALRKQQQYQDTRRIRAIEKPNNNAAFDFEPNALRDVVGALNKAESQGQLTFFPRQQKSFGVRVQAVPSLINVSEMKEAMAQFGNIINVSEQRGPGIVNYIIWFKNEEAANKALREQRLKLRDSWYRLGRQANPLTTVVRLSNLSSEVTTSKLRSTCENIARVAGVEMRKGGIVDVHFNVKDTTDMVNIIDRLSKLKFGEQRLKVFPAPRLFCREDPNNYFKPQDVQFVKKLKDSVLKQVERNMEKLSTELQDFRELLALKQSNMLEAYTKSLN